MEPHVRVLIADDNPWIRKGLRNLIEQHADWQVCGEVSDGVQAVQKTRELHPDLVLLDFRMPEKNGLEAGKEILQTSPGMPMILITFYGNSELAAEASKAGFRGILSKSDLMHIDGAIEKAMAA